MYLTVFTIQKLHVDVSDICDVNLNIGKDFGVFFAIK